MGGKETPKELDRFWERENIKPEVYYLEKGLTRKDFWQLYWEFEEVRELVRGDIQVSLDYFKYAPKKKK